MRPEAPYITGEDAHAPPDDRAVSSNSTRRGAKGAIAILRERDLPTDWSELGHRVLAEAWRRSRCEFRRRNGCATKFRAFRMKAGERP